jgi:hypothetical protein
MNTSRCTVHPYDVKFAVIGVVGARKYTTRSVRRGEPKMAFAVDSWLECLKLLMNESDKWQDKPYKNDFVSVQRFTASIMTLLIDIVVGPY